LDQTKPVGSQVVDRLLDDIVLNGKIISVSGDSGQSILDNSLGALNGSWALVDGVLGIKIEVDSVISKSLKIGPAASSFSAVRKRRAHVGREVTEDVDKGLFVLLHLSKTHSLRDVAQIVVRPGVGSNLMALGNHTLDDGWVRSSRINLTLTVVVSGNEESSSGTIREEDIKQVVGIFGWTVVEGQANHLCNSAVIDIIGVRD
jgi:hypothetical protein